MYTYIYMHVQGVTYLACFEQAVPVCSRLVKTGLLCSREEAHTRKIHNQGRYCHIHMHVHEYSVYSTWYYQFVCTWHYQCMYMRKKTLYIYT